MDRISKTRLETMLGGNVTDSMFKEALNCARQKQAYIYQREKREEVLKSWYLLELIKEYIKSAALSKFTLELCKEACKTKTECLR